MEQTCSASLYPIGIKEHVEDNAKALLRMHNQNRSRWMRVLKRAPQFPLYYENEFGMRFKYDPVRRLAAHSLVDYGISIWVTARRELITKAQQRSRGHTLDGRVLFTVRGKEHWRTDLQFVVTYDGSIATGSRIVYTWRKMNREQRLVFCKMIFGKASLQWLVYPFRVAQISALAKWFYKQRSK